MFVAKLILREQAADKQSASPPRPFWLDIVVSFLLFFTISIYYNKISLYNSKLAYGILARLHRYIYSITFKLCYMLYVSTTYLFILDFCPILCLGFFCWWMWNFLPLAESDCPPFRKKNNKLVFPLTQFILQLSKCLFQSSNFSRRFYFILHPMCHALLACHISIHSRFQVGLIWPFLPPQGLVWFTVAHLALEGNLACMEY